MISLAFSIYVFIPTSDDAAQWNTIEQVNKLRAENRDSIERIVECYNAAEECVLEWDESRGVVK